MVGESGLETPALLSLSLSLSPHLLPELPPVGDDLVPLRAEPVAEVLDHRQGVLHAVDLKPGGNAVLELLFEGGGGEVFFLTCICGVLMTLLDEVAWPHELLSEWLLLLLLLPLLPK